MIEKCRTVWRGLYAVCLTAIIVLSLDSSPPEIDLGVLNWDKFQHAAAYAVLTFLGVMALGTLRKPCLITALSAFAISALLGALLEVGQGTLTRTRYADFQDLLANLLGALAGMVAALYFRAPARQGRSR